MGSRTRKKSVMDTDAAMFGGDARAPQVIPVRQDHSDRWILPAGDILGDHRTSDDAHATRKTVTLRNLVPILIVRHGRAMARSNWNGRDQARPLDARGRGQATALIPLLAAYDVAHLASSTSTRCVTTLQPYAKANQLEIEGWATLSEEQAGHNPKAVDTLMRRLIAHTLKTRKPLAICGHRPVLPLMLTALSVPTVPLKPAACIVAHVAASGQTIAFEHHPPKA